MPWTYRDVSRGAFLYTGLQPHWDTCCRLAVETIRRNLSAAACMDYASPATAQMSEPQSGASCWAVAEISECNSYMSQHLDSRPVLVILIYSMSKPGTGALQMRVSETGRHTIISECITS